MLAKEWLNNTRDIMTRIEETQLDNIRKAAEAMADTIGCKALGSYFWMRSCHIAN